MKYHLDRKLYFVFISLVIIAIVNAVVITYNTEKSNRISTEITEVSNPAVTMLSQMENLVVRSRMYITNWVYVGSANSDRENLLRLNTMEYPRLKINLSKISALWKDAGQINDLKDMFDRYEKIISFEQQICRSLVSPADFQDPVKRFAAEEILQAQIIPAVQSLSSDLESLSRTKHNEAEYRHHEMQMAFIIMKAVLVNLAIFIILAVLFMTYYVTNKFLKPVMRIREIILQMGRGELPQMSLTIPRNTVGEMAIALRSLIDSLRRTSKFANEIGKANFSSHFQPLSEDDVLGKSLIEMRDKLRNSNEEDAVRNWITEGFAIISNILQQHSDNIRNLTNDITDTIVKYVGVNQAAIFLLHENKDGSEIIELSSYHALNTKLKKAGAIELGQGLLGEAIASNRKIYMNNLQDAYFTIDSGLGQSKSCSLAIIPLYAGGKVLGAIEVATLQELSNVKIRFLEKIAEPIAMNIFTVAANMTTKNLLADSIRQANELTAQKHEMRWANEELLKKSQLLEHSQEELRQQQIELKQANAELEQKAHLLQEQNMAMEEARQSLSFKAQQLEQSNKYKSAFLANMSHELRTPLNSVMILAKILSENKTGNLSSKQVEHAHVIFKSGHDLLTIINDILDFSKIEAGKIELNPEQVSASEIINNMEGMFSVLASEKGIRFSTTLSGDFPPVMVTDRIRLEQIIKNLLANAFKFTPKDGQISLHFGIAAEGDIFSNSRLLTAEKVLAVSVADTGIGIPEDKQKIVFEAFKQVDGSNSRKYGGTGLGLTISRELSILLGGDLTLHSIEGSGSTFTIYLPYNPAEQHSNSEAAPAEQMEFPASYHYDPSENFRFQKEYEIPDDRNIIHPGDSIILVIEDDRSFANTLLEICHQHQCKTIVAVRGDDGLKYARHYQPEIIILDMQLPVIDGWQVLSALKNEPSLQHIPVHIISAVDSWAQGLKMGAAGYLTKPVDNEQIIKILPVNKINRVENIPVNSLASESCTDEFLRPALPFNQADGDDDNSHEILKGKKVLIADDDMRNVYSLSNILESEGMNIVVAHDGNQALEMIRQHPDADIILMDIMMPEMDGYEAMRQIRKIESFSTLPIIALTAKAMKEDRQKCFNSGASDYITKPVNTGLLISAMKSWILSGRTQQH